MSRADHAPPRLDADAFLAADRAREERAELFEGVEVRMEAERTAHVRAKQAIWRMLDDQLRPRGASCEAFIDGLAVRASRWDVLEPDVLVRCGDRLDPRASWIDDPALAVEVISPSSAERDAGRKLRLYFGLPSLMAYLLVWPEERRAVLHLRMPAGTIETRLIGPEDPLVALAVPDLTLDPARMLPEP